MRPYLQLTLDGQSPSCSNCAVNVEHDQRHTFCWPSARGNGCAFCKVISEVLILRYPTIIPSEISLWNSLSGGLLIKVHHQTEADWSDGYIWVYRPPDSEDSIDFLSRFPRLSEICPTGLDEKCSRFAAACLKDCIDNHARCVPSRSDRRPPSRLLSLGAGKRPTLQLTEDSHDEDVKYAALSYCWGDGVPLTTTKQSLASRKDSIRWDALPSAFQDAVLVAQRLEIHYLWIDSLCIIQDSPQDWQLESACMADIYEGAVVTIAAVCSRSSAEHFLVPRPANCVNFAVVGITGQNSQLELLYARDSIPINEDYLGSLHTRAWAYQEKVLSTRILNYQTHELVWQCKSAKICECGHRSRKVEPASVTQDHITQADDAALAADDPRGGDPYRSWQACVGIYTARVLTYTTDRLPALAGIASVIHSRTGSSYLAGLCEENLLSDIQWAADWWAVDWSESKNVANRLHVLCYQGPTYSWASINLPIFYTPPYRPHALAGTSVVGDMVYQASVMESHSQSRGSNYFGEVEDGYVILEGPIFEMGLVATWSEDEHMPVCHIWNLEEEMETQSTPPIESCIPCVYPDALLGAFHRGEQEPTVRRLSREEPFTDFQGIVQCLGICRLGETLRAALIMGASPDVEGAYERLGLLKLGEDDDDPRQRNLIDRSWARAERRVVKLV